MPNTSHKNMERTREACLQHCGLLSIIAICSRDFEVVAAISTESPGPHMCEDQAIANAQNGCILIPLHTTLLLHMRP